jgi:hypothetical protein
MIATGRLALVARAAAARFARRRSCTRSGARLPARCPLSLRWAPRRKRLSAKPPAASAAAGLATQVLHSHWHWHLALRVDRGPQHTTAVSPALGWVRHAVRTSTIEWRRRIDPGLTAAAPGMAPRPPPQQTDELRSNLVGRPRPARRDDASAAPPSAAPLPARRFGSASAPVSLWSRRPLALVRRTGGSPGTTAVPTPAAAWPPVAAWPTRGAAPAQPAPAHAAHSVPRHALGPAMELPAMPASRRPRVGLAAPNRAAARLSVALRAFAEGPAAMERAPSSKRPQHPRNIAVDESAVATPASTWRRVAPKATAARRTAELVWPTHARNDRWTDLDTDSADVDSTLRRATHHATPSWHPPAELVWPTRRRGDLRSGDTADSADAPASAAAVSAGAAAIVLTPQAAAIAARAIAAQRANPLDAALIDRLAEDVIRRVERRVRIERERRGL